MTLMIGSIDMNSEPTLPFRIDGCSKQGNFTQISSLAFRLNTEMKDDEDILWIFRISFIYYGLIGTLVGLSTGYIASLLSGGNAVPDQRLLATFLRTTKIPDEEIQLRT